MTPTQQALYNRITRKAGLLSGSLSSEILKAHQRISDSYSEAEIARLIATHQIDQVIDRAFSETVLEAAYAPVRERMRQGVYESVSSFVRSDIPKPQGVIGIQFDTLSPDVIEAITTLDSRVIKSLKDENRDLVRAYIEKGLREGKSASSVAKNIKNFLGLSPNQLEAIDNYRDALERGAVKKAESYKLRDKRLKISPEMTSEQIEKSVAAYTKKMVSHNAETVARTAALDANKLAQHLAWESAIKQGVVKRDRLYKRWIGVMDSREREEHVAMQNQSVPFDMPYSNGEIIPGSSTFNCRCISHYYQRA